MKYITLVCGGLMLVFLSCNQNTDNQEEQSEIMELDSISETLDQSRTELESIQEDIQELDSILNEI
ncbi:MAG: hypothetical protein JXR19_11940 [Bacteroidia bacterium]